MSHRAYLLSLEQLGIKLGLDQIRALVAQLGRPDLAFRSILVAGTNGKGSVTAMVERGLRASGYRTGRYTSPHLVHLEERFVVNGRSLPAGDLETFAGVIREAAGRLAAPPSFFEATTALALEAFRAADVELAVLEVGLGGRLDATNIVDPIGTAITAVDFDHEAYLGDTIESIAREKAGVIKRGSLVVLGENPPAVHDVVRAACQAAGAQLVSAEDGVETQVEMHDGRTRLSIETPRDTYGDVALALRGRHQVANAITAVRLFEELTAHGRVTVTSRAVRTALEEVDWPARLEPLRWRRSEVLLDGAHNPAGARALSAYVMEAYGRPAPMVVGAMRDKRVDALLSALAPAASHFVFTAAATPRAASPGELAAAAARSTPGVPAEVASSPLQALRRAAELGHPVIVAGSLYLAGEIRAEIS
jgi:dihydrofolate synthase/folylpolyglutamate synthase